MVGVLSIALLSRVYRLCSLSHTFTIRLNLCVKWSLPFRFISFYCCVWYAERELESRAIAHSTKMKHRWKRTVVTRSESYPVKERCVSEYVHACKIYRFRFSLFFALTCTGAMCINVWSSNAIGPQNDAQTKRHQHQHNEDKKTQRSFFCQLHIHTNIHTYCIMEYTTNEIILFLVKASLFHFARSFIRSFAGSWTLIHIESLLLASSRFVCACMCVRVAWIGCYCFDDILDSVAAAAVFLFSLTQYWRAHTRTPPQNITVKKWNHKQLISWAHIYMALLFAFSSYSLPPSSPRSHLSLLRAHLDASFQSRSYFVAVFAHANHFQFLLC